MVGEVASSNSDLWQAVLGELEVTLSKANYRTWFKNTSLASIDSGSATITVPNIFTREWIEKKYHDQIFTALGKLVDGLDNVCYKIGSIDEGSETSGTAPSRASKAEGSKYQNKNNILEKYNFKNFVVGGGNRLAFAAAKLVSEKPGSQYNPLFLYGPAGVGKTHLLWAILSEITKASPEVKVVYSPSDDFYNEFIRAIREGQTKRFTDKYRKVDVLLVDDLQFLAGKEKTQEEFFHTFNALHQAGKQIVLSSDRPPKAIPTLEDRLRSRFEWGMVADIQPPDLETRIAILQNKANLKNIVLSEEVILYIAQLIEDNIRELEGALIRIVAFCEIQNLKPTLDVVESILGSFKKGSGKTIHPKYVLEKTALFYNLKPADLVGLKRDKQIVLPRQVAMYIMRQELNMSFPQIARSLGGRDHTTVMHGVKKINQLLSVNEPLQYEVRTLKEKVLEV